MSADLSKRPKLLIISDTAVYKDTQGRLLAFEPVAREIEHFYHLFDSIIWIAAQYPYQQDIRNIKEIKNIPINYVLFPAVGGPGLFQKFKIIFTYLRLSVLIFNQIRRNDVIHSRGPSHPAIISAFYSMFFKHKIFWHKYAGNWARTEDPYSYRIQKWLVKKATNSKVTINGKWHNQPAHFLSFENPCITEEELHEGKKAIERKKFDGKLDFVFVGNLVDTKGASRILEAFAELKNEPKIGKLHLIGDGPKRKEYMNFAKANQLNVVFHGFLPKPDVNRILSTVHVLLLPSDSEGFPKVVAEGANFGCIPIVSDISCLSQYINNNINGFLMPSLDTNGLRKSISILISHDSKSLKKISGTVGILRNKFTYYYYNEMIMSDILKGNRASHGFKNEII